MGGLVKAKYFILYKSLNILLMPLLWESNEVAG